MKKRILPLLLLAVLCLSLLCPLSVRAVTPLDTNAEASLTLHYQKDGLAFAGLSVSIYRVAQAFPDGSFELVEPFASYPIHIQGITSQTQWNHVAQTLEAYIVADHVAPDHVGETGENGTVHFSGLTTGLYFVREVVAESATGTYIFNQFLVYLPTPHSDGSFSYDVEAVPKCTDFVARKLYTVRKLWQDGGNIAHRPKEVTVEIYKDGTHYETQILSSENDWTYSWSVSEEDPGVWTVVEKAVPEEYKVTVQQNGGSFSIINTRESTPDNPPQTGDSFSPLLWILLLCLSGILLVIVGILARRRK